MTDKQQQQREQHEQQQQRDELRRPQEVETVEMESDYQLAASALAGLFAAAGVPQNGCVISRGAPGTYYVDSTGTYLVVVERVHRASAR